MNEQKRNVVQSRNTAIINQTTVVYVNEVKSSTCKKSLNWSNSIIVYSCIHNKAGYIVAQKCMYTKGKVLTFFQILFTKSMYSTHDDAHPNFLDATGNTKWCSCENRNSTGNKIKKISRIPWRKMLWCTCSCMHTLNSLYKTSPDINIHSL